jgi:hypothetical protein
MPVATTPRIPEGGSGAGVAACNPLRGVVADVVKSVAIERRLERHARFAGLRQTRRCTPAAERVGLVEEHDHTAITQRELAQLSEERLHLQDADPEEHVLERARIDEHVRAPGLASHRLGHERFAGSRRPPQQDAPRHVATLALDLLRPVEKHDVLFHLGQHLVLAPDIGEPRLDLLRHVGVDAAARHEPEDRCELTHAESEREEELEEPGQPATAERIAPQPARRLGNGFEERHTPKRRQPEHQERTPTQNAKQTAQTEAHPWVEFGGLPFPCSPHVLHPEAVIRGAVLTDDVVELPDCLDDREPQQPALRAQCVANRVRPRHDRNVAVLDRRRHEEQDGEDHENLGAVPEIEVATGLGFAIVGRRGVHRCVGIRPVWAGERKRGRRRDHWVTFQDEAISSIRRWFWR